MSLDPDILFAAERLADAIDAARDEVGVAADEDADRDELSVARDAVRTVEREYDALLRPLSTDARAEVRDILETKLAQLKAQLHRVG